MGKLVANDRSKRLGEGDVKKVIISMAIPSIIGMVINGVYNIADTIFVGRLGTSAVGAVAVVFPLFMIIGAVGLAIGVGAGSYISRLLGQGRTEYAERTLITASVTVIGLGLLLALIGSRFIEPILKLFGASDTIMPFAIDYAYYLVIWSPIVMLKMALNNMLRAEGSAKASMYALVTGAVLNVVLDPIFIFVFDMGIVGAAVATIIGQAFAVAYQLWYYFTGRSHLKLSLKNLQPSLSIYQQIMVIGIPVFATQALNSIAMAMINNAASPYGDAAVAAMGIVNRVMSIAMFAVIGFGQGFQPVAGFNYGAKKHERLWEAIRFSVKSVTGFTIIAGTMFFVAAPVIISVFTKELEVIELGRRALRAYSVPFPLLGFQMIYFSLFQALGKAIPAALLSLSRQGLLLIPLVLILPSYLGVNGVVFAQPIADGLTLVMTTVLAIVINRQLKQEEFDLQLQSAAK